MFFYIIKNIMDFESFNFLNDQKSTSRKNIMENIFILHYIFLQTLTLSNGRICRPPPPSEVMQISWKMPTLLNQMKNHNSDFYFSSYVENSTKSANSEYNNHSISKTKNLYFIHFSPFRIFHVNLTTFEKKNYFDGCDLMPA